MKREFLLEAVIERGEWPITRDAVLRLLEDLARP
jgi:hypothetical protein